MNAVVAHKNDYTFSHKLRIIAQRSTNTAKMQHLEKRMPRPLMEYTQDDDNDRYERGKESFPTCIFKG